MTRKEEKHEKSLAISMGNNSTQPIKSLFISDDTDNLDLNLINILGNHTKPNCNRNRVTTSG